MKLERSKGAARTSSCWQPCTQNGALRLLLILPQHAHHLVPLTVLTASRSLGGATYTPEASALIADIGRYISLAHILFWAARSAAKQTYLVEQSAEERSSDQLAPLRAVLSHEGARSPYVPPRRVHCPPAASPSLRARRRRIMRRPRATRGARSAHGRRALGAA